MKHVNLHEAAVAEIDPLYTYVHVHVHVHVHVLRWTAGAHARTGTRACGVGGVTGAAHSGTDAVSQAAATGRLLDRLLRASAAHHAGRRRRRTELARRGVGARTTIVFGREKHPESLLLLCCACVVYGSRPMLSVELWVSEPEEHTALRS